MEKLSSFCSHLSKVAQILHEHHVQLQRYSEENKGTDVTLGVVLEFVYACSPSVLFVCLFIYGLFNEAVFISDYIALNG
jgi:hypothetical protein